MGIELDADLSASLSALIDRGTRFLTRAERLSRARAAGINYVVAPALSLAALPAVASGNSYGPNDGFIWAIQRMGIANFGAATDFVNVYRGTSPVHVQPQNLLQCFVPQSAANLNSVAWHPGGKGLILNPEEGLVFSGTITGIAGVAASEVIQVEDAFIFDFLT